MLIQRAINVVVISLASSTRPSSSRSCTDPRMPDSKADATSHQLAISSFPKQDLIFLAYSTRAYSSKPVSKVNCLEGGMLGTYLVCSPTNIICPNVSRVTVINMESTHVVLGLEVSGNIQLVHANGWRCPARALERIQDPAPPVIFARVLVPRHVSMYLNHRVQHVLDMLFFCQRSKPNPEICRGVAC